MQCVSIFSPIRERDLQMHQRWLYFRWSHCKFSAIGPLVHHLHQGLDKVRQEGERWRRAGRNDGTQPCVAPDGAVGVLPGAAVGSVEGVERPPRAAQGRQLQPAGEQIQLVLAFLGTIHKWHSENFRIYGPPPLCQFCTHATYNYYCLLMGILEDLAVQLGDWLLFCSVCSA